MGDETRNRVPVMDNAWVEKNGVVYLIGSVCEDCGEVFFPQKEIPLCAHCQSARVKDLELSAEGVIHSYTVVHQMPAGGYYKGAVPFIYGIVEMPEGVHIQGHVIGFGLDEVRIGDRVKVVLDTLFEEDQNEVITYKFAPIRWGETS